MKPFTVTIEFRNIAEFQDEIREVIVRSLNEAIFTARGDIKALNEIENVFKEALYLTHELIGAVKYGPMRKKENPGPDL